MKHIIVGTAGHIDHGKTSLVKALTGIDADRLKEEKQRGITIDIGFADLAIGDVLIGFVDVPGHERFIKNMLAGAHGLDMVMLVVAADESVMPQTREHFDICRLLDIKSGLIALTKADMVDEELLQLAQAEVEDYVRGSFLEGAPIIAVSSRTGAGIEDLKTRLAEIAASTAPKTVAAVPRLPIDRAFSIKGFGTVVTGTLIAGQIQVGDEMEVLPSGQRTRARNVQVHGADTNRAEAGQRTAINLQSVNVDQIERGMILAPAGRLQSTRMIDARLTLLHDAPKALTHRARVRFHIGTAEIMARIVVLEKAAASVPARIEPGQSKFVQFRLEQPVTALPGDHFIIRSYSPQLTIGGGLVLDPLPEKHRPSDVAAAKNLAGLDNADVAGRIRIFVEMAGSRAMTIAELAARTGATDQQITGVSAEHLKTKTFLEVSATPLTVMSSEAYQSLGSAVESTLKEHHRREPLSLGLGREEVRERLFGGLRPEVFRAVISQLASTGVVVAERDMLRLKSHQMALSETDAEAKRGLENAFRSAGLQAITLEEAAASTRIDPASARKLYNLLVSERRLVRIADFVFHSDTIEQLKTTIRSRKSTNPRIDVAVFKDITGGLTRKHAIPLLEFLDRERITRRVGNEREIL